MAMLVAAVWGKFRHHPVETKATFALAKLAFNGIANAGILSGLVVEVGFCGSGTVAPGEDH
jgi:hypothetical protein